MPEGPSVKKFQLLTSPFVGQVVTKVGGSSRKINVNELKALKLQDSQGRGADIVNGSSEEMESWFLQYMDDVHGKNLFLAFVAAGDLLGPSAEDMTLQREACGGASSAAREGQEQVCAPQTGLPEEEPQEAPHSRFDAPDAGCPGNWLRVHFGLFGSIRANEFSRANKANKRGDWKDPIPRLVLHFESGGFLVFYNCRMHWCSSPMADPASDILSVEFHRGRALDALRTPNPVCYTLLDQRYFSGLGNIIKNEILYMAKIHPLAQGSLLAVSDRERLLDYAIQFSSDWLQSKLHGKGLHPQIYQKEQCPLGHAVMRKTLGPLHDFKRLTWWCPQCQPAVPSESGNPSLGTE